jgi:hypothetical protein
MSRLLGLTCVMMFAFCVAKAQSPKFLSYKKVEAYQIRPGILAMPRYSVNGEVCEIGLERRHYSPEKIYLEPALSREEIDQIADEVAPINERGSRTKLMLGRDLIVEAGNSLTTISDYENISIETYSSVEPSSKKRETVATDVAAVIKWKNRKCE